jgi:hypothetical protein
MIVSQLARALDANEIAMLVQRNVDESTIVELIRNRPLEQPLSATDVVRLHNAGATDQLLEFLTSAEAVAAAPAPEPYAVPVAPAPVVTPQPPVVYAPTVGCAPVYVTPSPVVVHRSYPSYPRYSFSFGFGGGHRWGGHRRYGHRGHHGRW